MGVKPENLEQQALNFAKALVLLYEDGGFGGIADEMSYYQIKIGNSVYYQVEAARALIAAQADENVQ